MPESNPDGVIVQHLPDLKPLPRWVSRLLPSGTWVTLSPTIYHPRDVDPAAYPHVILHEHVHLRQQASGLLWWLLQYVLSRKFRLEAEAEAYAVEIKSLPEEAQPARLAEATQLLSGVLYFRCAGSASEAETRINLWRQRPG